MNGIGDYVTSIKESRNLVAQVVADFKGESAGHPFRGNQYGEGNRSFGLENHSHEMHNASDVIPINEIDEEHVSDIQNSMAKNGWQGRPILAYENEWGNLQGVTGSHRIEAARRLNMDIPVSIMKFNNAERDDIRDFTNASGDDDRYHIAKNYDFVGRGIITLDQFNLLKQEYDENK